jgi:O-antigen/teichoic acid export membrane protein
MILGSAFLLKVIGALTGMALTIAAASFMNVKTPDWLVLISISTLSFLFMPFEVLDYFFQSLVMSKYIVFARNFSLIASSAVRLYLISAGGSLMAFLLVNVIEAALTFIALIVLFSKKNSISGWKFSAGLMKTLMIDSFPLMMTYLMTLIGMKIDQLMLLEMIDEKQLGYYSAAIKLSEIWYLIPMSVCSTFFPILIAIKKRSISLYMKRFQMLYDFMAVTAFAIILPVSFLSAKLIPLLYGPKYVNSAAILAIHVWAVLPVFMSVVCQYYLIVEKKQRLSFYKTIVGVITTVISNYILIPRYAAAGAACARLISEFVSSYLFDMFHPALAPALKMKIRATTLISLFNNTAIFLARIRAKK